MPVTKKSALRVMPIAITVAAFGLVAPQASATENPAPNIKISPNASKETRAFAKANPKVVSTVSSVCGSGYTLVGAVPLPKGTNPKMRLGTLYNYTKGGADVGCSIYDNNTGKAQTMSVKVCDAKGNCQEDKGKFSQYAGPVRTSQPVCATVSAYMQSDNGTKFADYSSEYAYLCN